MSTAKSSELTVIIFQRKWVQNGEFLLVIVAANYSICHDYPPSKSDMSKSQNMDCLFYTSFI